MGGTGSGHDEPVEFTVPPAEYGEKWRVVVDTALPGAGAPVTVPAAAKLTVPDRSLLVLDREV